MGLLGGGWWDWHGIGIGIGIGTGLERDWKGWGCMVFGGKEKEGVVGMYGWIIAFEDGMVRLCAIKKGYGRYDGGYR